MNPNQVPILGFEILESIKGQIYYWNSFDLEQVVKSIFSFCQKHLYLAIGNALIFSNTLITRKIAKYKGDTQSGQWSSWIPKIGIHYRANWLFKLILCERRSDKIYVTCLPYHVRRESNYIIPDNYWKCWNWRGSHNSKTLSNKHCDEKVTKN